MKILKGCLFLFVMLHVIACKLQPDRPSVQEIPLTYTCPMPEDSFYSPEPGQCPKCGMDLVQTNFALHKGHPPVFTCPMHPEIMEDEPGSCPICNMKLVQKNQTEQDPSIPRLEDLLKPTHEFIISTVRDTTLLKKEVSLIGEATGVIDYDTREVYRISSNTEGRIEKLYIRYRFQKIHEGQRIMDVYSPELVTAQQNLLFLLRQDPDNESLVRAAKQKLILLGMQTSQMEEVIKSGEPSLTVGVYSKRNGYVIETERMEGRSEGAMANKEGEEEPLTLKEGMYVQKGQPVLSVYDPKRTWAIINIHGENQGWIKIGNEAILRAETSPQTILRGKINFIEPFYQKGSKTLTARIYLDHRYGQLPIGSRITAKITGPSKTSYWLPKSAVLSSGLQKVVFLKKEGGFKAIPVQTGLVMEDLVEFKDGLSIHDRFAINAQYLLDSESFITVKNKP